MAIAIAPSKEKRGMEQPMAGHDGARPESLLPMGAPARTETRASRAVVVHSGARDNYQVARALDEAGQLEALVTDLYWPAERSWAAATARYLPASLRTQLGQRYAPCLRSDHVRQLALRGLATLLADKQRHLPFRWRQQLMRRTDAALGREAGRLARRSGATLLSYSYYGYHAFSECPTPGMLFQLHPHPGSMRRILEAELARHPDCAESLGKEWELSLPEEDFERLVDETRMAAHFLVASSFTRATLVENGTPADAITVIPYGVDTRHFSPAQARRVPAGGPLRLLFVGRINQRKGIKYLLEALRLLREQNVQNIPEITLTVCGRVVDGLELFKPFAGQVEVRPSVSAAELLAAYREADLFVFPSVAEGFGQVLLESLACGLPVLSTTSTAAPDLIEDGVQGFLVEPGRADLLAERIAWAASHPEALLAMRGAARARAEQFTWGRFRAGVAQAFEQFCRSRGALDAAQDAIRNAAREVRHV